jgi:hypothetical protein
MFGMVAKALVRKTNFVIQPLCHDLVIADRVHTHAQTTFEHDA